MCFFIVGWSPRSYCCLVTTGFVAGDYILLRLFRDADGTGGTDDFAGDARVLDYHIEYLSDKIGEGT